MSMHAKVFPRIVRVTVLVVALFGVLFSAPPMTTFAAAAQQPAATPPPASATPTQQPPAAQPARPPAAQDEFVPVEDLPDSEKLPAAPFLIAAYTIVWLVLLLYVWSLWRRITHVEKELKQAVESAMRD
jgi:CcmD family protein